MRSRDGNGFRLLLGRKEIGLVLVFLLMLMLSPAAVLAGAVQLPQTGQTGCWDESGNAITCASTGQDGDKRAGAAWPEARFTDNGNQTMTDNLTGLIWTKDGNAPGPQACVPGTTRGFQGALDYVACLNTNNYLSYSDWRLPNRKELKSLLNRQQDNTSAWLNNQGFSNVQPNFYMSSSIKSGSSGYAWLVNMENGDMGTSMSGADVWPVRGGQSGTVQLPKTGQTESYAQGDDGALQKGTAWPNPRFTNNGNGTVTDNLTGLIWLQNTNCQETVGGISKASGVLNWLNALIWSKNLESGACELTDGSKAGDWRLPNVEELESLIDLAKNNQALPVGHPFSNVQSNSSYWSSSTYSKSKYQASTVEMVNGGVSKVSKKTGSSYVWPVRGGQSVPSGSLYASFTNFGLYKYEANTWRLINSVNPDAMTASGGILYADFANYGLYKYTGGVWSQINTVRPTNMLSSDGKLYATFTGYGFYQYDNATGWKLINSVNPDSMTISGGILYPVFKDYGFYKYDGATWTQINSVIPNKVVAGE